MKKGYKIALKVLAVLFAIVLLLFAGGWIYLKQHKRQVISFIETEAKKGLNGGTVSISNISIGFRHTFPRIAFTIDTLTLRDSLWFQHHHNLIYTPRAYATSIFLSLFLERSASGGFNLRTRNFIFTPTPTVIPIPPFSKKMRRPKKMRPKTWNTPSWKSAGKLCDKQIRQ